MTITEILNILWFRLGILVKKTGKNYQPIFTKALLSHIRSIRLLAKGADPCQSSRLKKDFNNIGQDPPC